MDFGVLTWAGSDWARPHLLGPKTLSPRRLEFTISPENPKLRYFLLGPKKYHTGQFFSAEFSCCASPQQTGPIWPFPAGRPIHTPSQTLKIVSNSFFSQKKFTRDAPRPAVAELARHSRSSATRCCTCSPGRSSAGFVASRRI